MKRTVAFGGLVAVGGLLSAGLAVPANAQTPKDEVPSVVLANTNLAARQIAAFWYGERLANLIGATPYNVETKVVAKHVSKGGPTADSKPGIVPAIGDEKKAAAKSKNVNLPKTTGKVFFIGADHRPHWCSATSVQANYRNLVATAGHCVYDTESNKATLDKWVFIPGYYQGKTPWGIYVGKQAFTHYDYDVYEDGDRDYAFVTVYNGVLPVAADKERYQKTWKTEALAKADKAKIENDKTTGYSEIGIEAVLTGDVVAPGTAESRKVENIAVNEFKRLNPAKELGGDGPWTVGTGASAPAEITKDAYGRDVDSYVGDDGKTYFFRKEIKVNSVNALAKPKEPGNDGDGGGGGGGGRPGGGNGNPGGGTGGGNPGGGTGGGQSKQYKYFKRTFWANYDLDYQVSARYLSVGLKDVGRLGDNVGGQGLAYNQKLGGPVYIFGYPSGSQPDGNYAFTGKTLKWAYGKTFPVQAPAIKGEELQGLRTSFTGEGALGSSWLLKYNNGRRLGYLNGVTIGVSDTDNNDRYDTSISPYFDGETYGVYKYAANLWSGKIV
ncbi:trypsin-like serine peptidase [Microtetraspora malaysiensis]|uniref:trypsin-like serine peptidase n=1 Tax=Microtetraspora malaysiensis TaxID=161358 RepID=UPI003D94A647